jgi:hypothetical protein
MSIKFPRIKIRIPSDYELIGIKDRKKFLKSIKGGFVDEKKNRCIAW